MVDWTQLRASMLGDVSNKNLLPEVKLPVLPKAVSEFSQKAENPDVDIKLLARIVESDSGLTCQLLRNVNAAANSMRHRIASAQHAIASLGVRRTKLFLITAALQQALPVRQLKVINLAAFWNTNLERAFLAKRIAELLKADSDLAFAASMLQDFLVPVLTNELDQHYLQYLKQQQSAPVELAHFEQQVFGWNHAEAGARVMFDLQFPDDLVCCVLLHHHGLPILADKDLGRTAATAVALAALMPDSLRQVPDGVEQLGKLDEIWKVFNLRKIADEVFEAHSEQALDAVNYIPFRDHCQQYFRAKKDAELLAACSQ